MTYLGDPEADRKRLEEKWGDILANLPPYGTNMARIQEGQGADILRESWLTTKEPEPVPDWIIINPDDYDLELPHPRHGWCNLQQSTIDLLEYGVMDPAFKRGSVVRVLTDEKQRHNAGRVGIVLDYELFASREFGGRDYYEYTVLIGTEKVRVGQGLVLRT